jgi:pyruvate/2-oxoglutarate dehydrogenase complex dihydrolipoamide dehydrogenase (E3) component
MATSEALTLTPDLCVIGGGSGGLAAAEAARALGASVVLCERGRLGGSLLHAGAFPAAALAAAAAHAEAMRSAPKFGIAADEPKPNFRRVHDAIAETIAGVAPDHAAARLEALGVEIVTGSAVFAGPDAVSVEGTTIRARRFVIATGSRPVVPAIPGLAAVPYFTTDSILDNTRKLTHLVIVGGGPAALELAQAYRRLGTQVTVVTQEAPLPGADPELAEIVLRRLGEDGVDIRTGTGVAEIQPRAMGTGVLLRSGETEAALDVSHILVAGGRVPELDGLDLGKAGIGRLPNDPARLALTPSFRTTNRKVYAIGDCATVPGSVEAARRAAATVVRAALLGLPRIGRAPPELRAVHTDPGLAEVGLSEAEARRRLGNRFRIERIGFGENDLSRARRETGGLVKLIAAPGGRLLGAGIAGPGAGELAAPFAVAIAAGFDARRLGAVDFPWPSRAVIAGRIGETLARAEGAGPILARWQALMRLLP